MRLGEDEESWDRFVVESPVAVVGAVDTSSEDSEMADSSRLTPTMAGYIPSTRNGGVEGTDMCSDRENMFLELVLCRQQTLGIGWRTMHGAINGGPRGQRVVGWLSGCHLF